MLINIEVILLIAVLSIQEKFKIYTCLSTSTLLRYTIHLITYITSPKFSRRNKQNTRWHMVHSRNVKKN